MNKFLAFAVFALIASASAQSVIDDEMSQFAITTSDTEEVASMPAELKIAFEDFCISSRDWVLNDIKQSTNSMTSSVFKIFFNSVEALGRESMDNQKEASEKLSKQLANPSAQVERAEGRLNQIIADGQQKIQGQSPPLALVTAIKTAFVATSSSVGDFFNDKLDALKKYGSVEQLGVGINEVCSKVRYYEEEIKSQLEQYKTAALNNEDKYAQVTLDQVKCATASRLSQIEGGCRFANSLRQSAEKIFAF